MSVKSAFAKMGLVAVGVAGTGYALYKGSEQLNKDVDAYGVRPGQKEACAAPAAGAQTPEQVCQEHIQHFMR